MKCIRPGFGLHPKYYVRDPVSVDSVVKGVNYIFNAAALEKVLLELPEVKSKAVPFLVSTVVAYFLTTEMAKACQLPKKPISKSFYLIKPGNDKR